MLGDEPDGSANIRGNTHPDEMPNYVILEDTNNDPTEDIEPLELPSGYQTGIKLVHEFTLEACITADLVLDFDAARSVVVAGQSGKYILNPTIMIIDIEEFLLVRGVVTSGGDPLPAARVSAQVFDAEAPDGEDPLTVVTSTVTDENGAYQMYVPVGSYNIVAYKRPGAALEKDDYYGPACGIVNDRFTGSVYEQNLSLGIFQTGDILITVSFPANGEEDLQTASISVSEASVCSQSTDFIEIALVVGSESTPDKNMFEYTLSVLGILAEAEKEGTPYTVVAESGGALIEKKSKCGQT
ncbi:MAG: DUF4382 domain-containing protein [Desulfobacterales bacterium]|nr:DUF4382 domain-containing protein [Desulfobacterales bacterium]